MTASSTPTPTTSARTHADRARRVRVVGDDLGWVIGRPPWRDRLERARAEGKRIPPPAPGRPGIGHLLRLRRGRIAYLLEAMRTRGDTFVVEAPWLRATFFVHPEQVRHVLQLRHENYGKQTRGFEQLRIFLGNGLLTSEGSFWLRQRRIAQPAFHKQRLAAFAGAMARAGEDLVDRWLADRSTEIVDVSRDMMRVTLRIVSETLLGRDVSGEADAVGHAITELLENVQARMATPVDLPLHWPTRINRQYHRAAAVVDDVVNGVIAERRARPNREGGDLLQMLIDARDEETGEGMSDRQLRDEAVTLFIAGHETTANALAWTFHLLSLHPGVRRQLRDELDRVLSGRLPTIDDLPKLEWTRMIVHEAMRLYPPAWIVGRNVIEDDEVHGWFVPGGTLAFVAPMLTHRHPDFWDDPEGFDPERFSPARSAGRPAYAYFPFGGGPRQCIGNNFALMEAQLLLATIARRVDLDHLPGMRVEPEPLVTLRPNGGTLPMRLRPRG